VRGEAVRAAARVVIDRHSLPQPCLKRTEGCGRLGCQEECCSTAAMGKQLEAGKGDRERGDLSAGSCQGGDYLSEGGAQRERVEQRDVRHPAARVAVVLLPDSLDGRPDLRRRDEDNRGGVGLRAHAGPSEGLQRRAGDAYILT
jgi:hypothetical protein